MNAEVISMLFLFFFSLPALEDRVVSNEDVLVLYGEQLGVHENSISLLEEQVNTLDITDNTMEAKINELEAVDKITEERLDNLSDRVAELGNITASHQNNIDNLVIADNAHDDEINGLQDVSSEFEDRIAQLEQDSESRNVSMGFHARLTTSNIPDAGIAIKYQNVMVNAGNCYSPNTGIFTAQIAGLYYFEQYWYMGSGEQSLYLWKNGVQQCKSAGYVDESNDHNSPSCSAAMELIPGDEVYVTSGYGHDVGSAEWNGFTGFLIQPY